MITPHLSHDWEAGRRVRVSQRLNLFLKLFAFGLVACGMALQLAAPLLFTVAFEGKFAAGLSVLPWTIAYCIWSALSIVSHNWVLCAEKARLTSLTLVVGLSVNILLNLLLLPSMGLLGAVLATAAAHAVTLSLSYGLNLINGMQFDRGTLIVSAAPALLVLGPWITLAGLATIVVVAISGRRLLTLDEKRQLAATGAEYYSRLKALMKRRQPAQA
jgi:O-antigen/teichoic acid export membrane protein